MYIQFIHCYVNTNSVCFIYKKIVFKHCFWAISWRPVFNGGGNRSAQRKPQTFDRKTDNPSQLRLESSVPTQARFELATSVLTG